jgi:predicted nucleotidyltransferase
MNMKPSTALASNNEAIRKIVFSHKGRNPRVFGSVSRGEDADGSDLDILVDPEPDMTLLDIGAMRSELKQLLGIQVDVLTPKALPLKFRDRVLHEAVPV